MAQQHEPPGSVVVITHLNAPLLRVTEVNGYARTMRAPALSRSFLNRHTVRLEMVDDPWHVLFAHHQAKMVEIRAQWHCRGRDWFLQREQINHRIGVDADRRERHLPLPKLLEALRLKTEHIGVKIQDSVHILDVQHNMVHCSNTKHRVILLWLPYTACSHITRALLELLLTFPLRDI